MSSSLFEIVAHTPLWVWPLMLLVLALGWYGLRSRTVPPARLAILPLAGLGTSVATILQSADPGLAAAGWAAALLVALPLGYAIGRRRAVRVLPTGHLEIAGGWFMLGFGVSIFAARYALGALFGMNPSLKAIPLWIVLSGGVGGAIAGLGFGWLGGLLLLRRRHDLAPPRQTRRFPWTRRIALGFVGILVLLVGGFGAVIALDGPVAPPRLAAGDTLPGFSSWNMAEIPAVSRVTARDGAPLTYRLYPGRRDRAVVLVHGSSGASISMQKAAQALQAAGATIYSISLRGHGGSGTTNGDSSYEGQLDDDLADFVKAVGIERPGIHKSLVGFSSGGGFVLRAASGTNRGLFDTYLAISPYIAYDSPTERPASGGWASIAVPRMIALSILDGFGLPWFQGLPVVRFATNAGPSDNRTPIYSYRLLTGMQLGRDWRARIPRIDRPTTVMIGSADELFVADQMKPLFAELNPAISVSVQPGLGHMDMITDPRAWAAVAATWQRLAGDSGS